MFTFSRQTDSRLRILRRNSFADPSLAYRHLTLLLCVFRYFISYLTFRYYSRWAMLSYRLAFVSAAVTYGIVVYKQYIARGRLQGNSVPALVMKLAGDENVQYLGLSPHHKMSCSTVGYLLTKI